MTPLKKILKNNLIYILIFGAATLLFMWPEDSGKGDPSGRAMMDGFFMLIGLAGLLVLAIVFVIVNLRIAIKAKGISLKLLAVIPVLIPLFILGHQYFGIGTSNDIEVEVREATSILNSNINPQTFSLV